MIRAHAFKRWKHVEPSKQFWMNEIGRLWYAHEVHYTSPQEKNHIIYYECDHNFPEDSAFVPFQELQNRPRHSLNWKYLDTT